MESLFNTVFESTSDGMVISDKSGTVVHTNKALCSIFGLTKDDILGHPLSFIIPTEAREHITEHYAQSFSTQEPLPSFEGKLPKNSDEDIWIDTRFSFIQEKDRPPMMLTVIRDVTEKRKFENALKESQYLLLEAQKITQMGHYVFDAKSGYWTSSQTLDELFGIDDGFEKNVEGWISLVAEDEKEAMQSYLLQEVVGKQMPFDKEYHIIRQDNGKKRLVHGKGRLYQNAQGTVERMVGTIQDITDQKKTELELREMNATKDKLFSIIAHDLNSPFRSLIGLLKLAERDMLTPDELKMLLGDITQDVNYTTHILYNLLNWAKSQMDGAQIIPQTHALFDVIDQIVAQNYQHAQRKGIALSHAIPKTLSFFADLESINLIVRNLVGNAIKFCNTGDSISITAKLNENLITIAISDTGIGIPADKLPQLFKKSGFTKTGTRNEKGTGLGLSLCHEFAEKNGGKLWVESQENIGSTFYFTIPTQPSPTNAN